MWLVTVRGNTVGGVRRDASGNGLTVHVVGVCMRRACVCVCACGERQNIKKTDAEAGGVKWGGSGDGAR